MSPLPTMGPLAAENYGQLSPLATGAPNGYALANFVAALCGPIEDVAGWVAPADDEPGYAILLDLGRAPTIALPWLGQLKGVRVTPGLTDAATREEIANAEGFHRGTVDALVRATQRRLTGTKTVIATEREAGDAYALTVIVRSGEMPDPAGTLADAMAAKRIGVLLTLTTSDAPFIDQGTRTIDASTGNIDTATIADIT